MTHLSRGLLAGVSIGELQQRTVHPSYHPYWERLTRRWREVDAWEKETGKLLDIGSCSGNQFTWLVREAALDYRLTGNREALDYVGRQIDKLDRYFREHPVHRLLENHPYWSESHVCLAADLCRDGLDDRRLATLKRLVHDKFLEATHTGWDAPYRFLAGHNKPTTELVCAGICALTWGEEAGRSDWEELVRRTIDACVAGCRHGHDRQGFGYEGTMYAYLGMDVIYLFAQLLFQNGRENLFQLIPELSAYPNAIRNLLFPDRIGLSPWVDGGIQNPKSYAFLLLTARHYNRPEDLGLWYEYRGPGRAADPVPNNNPSLCWPDVGPTGPVRADGWGHDLYPFLWWDADAPRTPVEKSVQPLALYSPGTELAFFRTSWSREAVFLNVSGQGRGHTCYDHLHADAGHFTLFAHGEYLAIDTGYFNRLEEGHSVVLVENQGQFNRDPKAAIAQHYAGRLTGFQRHALLDYVMVDQAAPRNCVAADRHLLFVRTGGDDAYVVLIDNVNPDHQAHAFQWQLQAHPESTVRLTGDTTAVVEKPRARLELTFLSPPASDFPTCPHALSLSTDIRYGGNVLPEGAPPPEKPRAPEGSPWIAWNWHAYTREQARRMKSELAYTAWYWPRLVAEQQGPSCILMTVIAPRRAGAPPLAVRNASGRRVFRAEIEHGDGTDTVIAALDHSLIKFPDVTGYAEIAVIRRAKSGAVIDQWTLGGYPLVVRQ